MNVPYFLYPFVILAFALSGCVVNGPTAEPIATETPLPFLTAVQPTATPSPAPVLTPTLTPPATLAPQQAEDFMRALLKNPDCLAPCFWGIIPGKTTLGEARYIFGRLGLELEHTVTQGDEDFYALLHEFDEGLRVGPILTVQSDIVKNMDIAINPETQRPGVSREWAGYSPETLISVYGPPSKVDFSVGYPGDAGAEPGAWYYMTMYFDSVNLIASYENGDFPPPIASLRACPIADQFTLVRLFFGPDPEHPPLPGVPLEEATSMTMEEFSNLMTGPPEEACFNLKPEMFP